MIFDFSFLLFNFCLFPPGAVSGQEAKLDEKLVLVLFKRSVQPHFQPSLALASLKGGTFELNKMYFRICLPFCGGGFESIDSPRHKTLVIPQIQTF